MLGRVSIIALKQQRKPVMTNIVRNYPGTDKIKVDLSEIWTEYPEPTQYFEDTQSLEPFDEENQGLNIYMRKKNTLYRQLSAVPPPEFITKVPYNSQDTLWTYTKRIHKIQMKTLAHWFRKMELLRMARLNELAVKEADVMFKRREEFRAWRDRKKAHNIWVWTIAQQKRAAELRTMYKMGKRSRENKDQRLAAKHSAQIELLLEEKRKTWILDPENFEASFFDETATAPTGWWPVGAKGSFVSKTFDTDDEDRDQYFTTKRLVTTRKAPDFDEFGRFYDRTANGEQPPRNFL